MRTTIEYPEHIEGRLARHTRLRGALDTTRDRFDGWLQTSRCQFFPDYADHGIDHLTNVLQTCVELMTKDARKV